MDELIRAFIGATRTLGHISNSLKRIADLIEKSQKLDTEEYDRIYALSQSNKQPVTTSSRSAQGEGVDTTQQVVTASKI